MTTIDTPSRFVDPTVRFNGPDGVPHFRANVILPDGYDGRRRFPVLYLLHGAGDWWGAWAEPKGDARAITRQLGAIVVMPEAGTGFYTDWWNGGKRGAPSWERFYFEELIPLIERRFKILPGRRWHAIAGLSMGGFGATYLASQLPGYFGSAATFSGFIAHQQPEIPLALPAIAGVRYEDIFGPVDGFYATGHNPARLTGNLRSTRLYVTVGNGLAAPGVSSSPNAVVLGGLAEFELRRHADEFVAAARSSGADTTYRPLAGVHDWPYWRGHLREAIDWGLFQPVPEAPTSWSYRTVAQRGEAWGLRYSFAAPPSGVVELSRRGDSLRGAGSGTVTIRNAAECEFTAKLPFDRALPPATCGTLRVTAAPRRLRVGRTTRVRVRVVRRVGSLSLPVAGARVALGAKAARTNRAGRAVLRYRPRGRGGVRRLRVSAPGLGRAVVRLRARAR
jgi:S-formylglutathione hydrolase FrmB